MEKYIFRIPAVAFQKNKKDEKYEIRVFKEYEYLIQKQKKSQKKMEKNEYDMYGALVAIKLRKWTKQLVSMLQMK